MIEGVPRVRPPTTVFWSIKNPTDVVADTVIVTRVPAKPQFYDLFANTFDSPSKAVIQDQGPIAILAFPVINNVPNLAQSADPNDYTVVANGTVRLDNFSLVASEPPHGSVFRIELPRGGPA